MKRIKEKLKCIYHIIFDSEYFVSTTTIKDGNMKSCCCIMSDNSSKIFLDCTKIILDHEAKDWYQECLDSGVSKPSEADVRNLKDACKYW